MPKVSAWNGKHQIHQLAAVQRKIFNGHRFNHLAERGVGGVKRGSKVLHLDHILNRSYFQSQVQRRLLIHFEAKILREGGKIWSLHLRSEEHTSELQSQSNLVCRLLLEKKKKQA